MKQAESRHAWLVMSLLSTSIHIGRVYTVLHSHGHDINSYMNIHIDRVYTVLHSHGHDINSYMNIHIDRVYTVLHSHGHDINIVI